MDAVSALEEAGDETSLGKRYACWHFMICTRTACVSREEDAKKDNTP